MIRNENQWEIMNQAEPRRLGNIGSVGQSIS